MTNDNFKITVQQVEEAIQYVMNPAGRMATDRINMAHWVEVVNGSESFRHTIADYFSMSEGKDWDDKAKDLMVLGTIFIEVGMEMRSRQLAEVGA